MNKFYFTFGDNPKFPYKDGWVEVLANGANEAINKFMAKYPNKRGKFNCAFVYGEESFRQSGMLQSGNFGGFCHEVIE